MRRFSPGRVTGWGDRSSQSARLAPLSRRKLAQIVTQPLEKESDLMFFYEIFHEYQPSTKCYRLTLNALGRPGRTLRSATDWVLWKEVGFPGDMSSLTPVSGNP